MTRNMKNIIAEWIEETLIQVETVDKLSETLGNTISRESAQDLHLAAIAAQRAVDTKTNAVIELIEYHLDALIDNATCDMDLVHVPAEIR